MITRLINIFKKKNPQPTSSEMVNTLDYWKTRAEKHGKRAVINLDHSLDQFETIRNNEKDILFPFLKSYLNGCEQLILDFGCGVGRYTCELADFSGCKVVGVDPTEKLLSLAPKHEQVEYRTITNGVIPLPDESVDLIWIYAVLGCIKDHEMSETCKEFSRVLKKDGIIFLVENTSDCPNSAHYSYRSAQGYMNLIPIADLKHVHSYLDTGKNFKEQFSVMAGRKK